MKIWDLLSGRETLGLKQQKSVVWSVAFSPDGKRLALGCGDSTVMIWDATPLEPGKE